MMHSTELGINFFGNETNKKKQLNKIEKLKNNIKSMKNFFEEKFLCNLSFVTITI